MTLRLGTRGSALAMAQSQTVADQVAAVVGEPVELVEIVTDGDRSAAASYACPCAAMWIPGCSRPPPETSTR